MISVNLGKIFINLEEILNNIGLTNNEIDLYKNQLNFSIKDDLLYLNGHLLKEKGEKEGILPIEVSKKLRINTKMLNEKSPFTYRYIFQTDYEKKQLYIDFYLGTENVNIGDNFSFISFLSLIGRLSNSLENERKTNIPLFSASKWETWTNLNKYNFPAKWDYSLSYYNINSTPILDNIGNKNLPYVNLIELLTRENVPLPENKEFYYLYPKFDNVSYTCYSCSKDIPANEYGYYFPCCKLFICIGCRKKIGGFSEINGNGECPDCKEPVNDVNDLSFVYLVRSKLFGNIIPVPVCLYNSRFYAWINGEILINNFRTKKIRNKLHQFNYPKELYHENDLSEMMIYYEDALPYYTV